MTVALLLGSAAPASAHAYLERTNPADGSVVAHAADQLALSFHEHGVLEATTIQVVDGEGATSAAPLGDGRWTVAGADPSAGTRSLRVTATRPVLPDASTSTWWTTATCLVALLRTRRTLRVTSGVSRARRRPVPLPRPRSEENHRNRSPVP